MNIYKFLKQAGIENAKQEARWITEYAEENDWYKIANRRANNEPLQYLLGEWEFYGYPFKVGPGVLIPRPETELLVDTVIKNAFKNSDKNRVVYDLCAGSGCVGITLAKEINCDVIAVENSPEAIKYLEENIELNNVRNQVKIIQGDVLNPDFVNSLIVNCQLSIVNCSSIAVNPPYLTKKEMGNLQKEVKYEPETALFGGTDGLDFYREIFGIWGRFLKPSELFAVEIGNKQRNEVIALMMKTGLFEEPESKCDFNGIGRVIYSFRI
jgi:release factor glutamine methyltransferase